MVVRRQPSLVFVLSANDQLVADVTRELAAIDDAIEIHVLRDEARLRTHVAHVTPDVVVLDRSSFNLVELATLFVLGPLAKAPALVLDDQANPVRRQEALAAGALDYLPIDAHVASRLRDAFLRARRIPALESRIAESERHYRDILESTSDGIFVMVDGRFDYVNQSFAQILALAPDELVGKLGVLDFVPTAQRDEVREAMARVAMSAGVRDVCELQLVSRAGTPCRLEIAFRTSSVDGHRAVVGVARDVTAVRELQGELERSRERVAQSERLRTLGELAAGVAHDFNNALEAILGRIDMARERLARGEGVEGDLEVIEDAARDAAGTVKRIREFSRPSGSDVWDDVDLTKLALGALELTRSSAPSNVELRAEAQPTPLVRGNPAELAEVLVNLLRNAIDACRAQGGTVQIRTCAEEGCAVVTVQDDGHGMSPEVQRHIFEPFFTTKEDAGTGLGLSVSHGILRRHDAAVQLDSAEGRGTTFRLSFAPLGDAAGERHSLAQGSKRVLVVDDDPHIGELLRDVLNEHGYVVTVATTVNDATQWIVNHDADLLITDLDLPGLSGWQLARQVRTIHPHIVIGLITGWPLGAPDGELKARGVDFVLTKPFSMDALLSALESLR